MTLSGLYLIIGEADLTRHGLANLLDQVTRAGVCCIQLREKNLSDLALYELARTVVDHLQPSGIPLIINDRIDIALASGAQGVHLGENDLPATVAREILGTKALIGLTIHSLAELEAAQSFPVDYYGVGPVYASPTKTALIPWGVDVLNEVVEQSDKPIFAIGGIGPHNIAEVLLTGVHGVCAISSVCGTDDPYQAAFALTKHFQTI